MMKRSFCIWEQNPLRSNIWCHNTYARQWLLIKANWPACYIFFLHMFLTTCSGSLEIWAYDEKQRCSASREAGTQGWQHAGKHRVCLLGNTKHLFCSHLQSEKEKYCKVKHMSAVSCSLYIWFYGNIQEGRLLCKYCLYCFVSINADLIFDTWQIWTASLMCWCTSNAVYSLEYKDTYNCMLIFTQGKHNSSVVCFDEGHHSSFSTHFLSRLGTCKNRAPGEWVKSSESELTSALHGPAITARNSHCSQLPRREEGSRGTDWSAATASELTAICVWSPGQTSPVPAESAIFGKSEWKSGFRQRRQLVRAALCLHPLLLKRERWDAGGNPTELKRNSSQNKGSCQGEGPQPFSHIVLPGKGVCSHFTYYTDGWRGNHLV